MFSNITIIYFGADFIAFQLNKIFIILIYYLYLNDIYEIRIIIIRIFFSFDWELFHKIELLQNCI